MVCAYWCLVQSYCISPSLPRHFEWFLQRVHSSRALIARCARVLFLHSLLTFRSLAHPACLSISNEFTAVVLFCVCVCVLGSFACWLFKPFYHTILLRYETSLSKCTASDIIYISSDLFCFSFRFPFGRISWTHTAHTYNHYWKVAHQTDAAHSWCLCTIFM